MGIQELMDCLEAMALQEPMGMMELLEMTDQTDLMDLMEKIREEILEQRKFLKNGNLEKLKRSLLGNFEIR